MRSLSTRHMLYAAVSLILTWALALVYRDALVSHVRSPLRPSEIETETAPSGILIKDKVATITDTLFTPHVIPLILHYRAVLGPSWPIVFFTSQATYDEHFSPNTTSPSTSAAWHRAVADGSIETRIVTPDFNLTTRQGVNMYLASPWLWEQLAPAKHVLVFQADAILCANAHQTVDDFLGYDFIGAPLNKTRKIYNGGLSIRNRTMVLDILNGERDWFTDSNTEGTEYGGHGEDVWMSIMMRGQDAHLPSIDEALKFAKELKWHNKLPGHPAGYHKVHLLDPNSIPKIREWCPEIDLCAPGQLE
ncbi:hypothetical protein B0T10DRAFT_495651 [Thelonectria olida]|uniref:DUF5672 domain-containing protein n=1 Tax=Thelonectria olida TaxID=1576542 RepID=A0A9P8VXK1_9HYPO|nr:hypothetical protein B0T10DRAFT_495651 [Thelonectria olida]